MSDDMQQQIDGLRTETGTVTDRLGTIETILRSILIEQSRLRGDMMVMFAELKSEIKSSRDFLLNRIDEHEKRIATLETKRS
jgi:hypothetical protein